MSAPPIPVTPPPERHWLTVRLSPKEKQWVTEQASIAGLSQSGYLRRQVFHGRPVLALTDEVMLRELRRLGGLLKSNFVTLRQAGCDPALQQSMEQTLEPFLVCFAKANHTRLRFAGKARFSRLLTARVSAFAATGAVSLSSETAPNDIRVALMCISQGQQEDR